MQGVSDRALRSRPDSRRQGQGYDDASQSRRSSARHATHTARWRSYADRAIGGLGCPSIILLRDGYGELSVSHMWCGCLCQGGNLGATGWRAHGHRACRRLAHAQSDRGIWNWARIGITEDCYRHENPPNGLAFSGAAPIDRESCGADSRFQNRTDLARRVAASVATPGWAASWWSTFNSQAVKESHQTLARQDGRKQSMCGLP